jgi:acetyl esterase/lipase
VRYAQRLADAGILTELHVYPGAFHAFDNIAPEASVAKRFTADYLAALKEAFRARG